MRPAPGDDEENAGAEAKGAAPAQGEEESPNPIEAALESTFEELGRIVARQPWVFIAASLLITVVFGAGRSILKDENRANKQWVPDGALALEHSDYVAATWPSQQRFSMWIATCADVDEASCNMLTAARMKRLFAIHKEIMDITVDGDKVVKYWDDALPGEDRVWANFAGDWSFEGAGDMGFGGTSFNRTWLTSAQASAQNYTCLPSATGGGGCCQESLRQSCDCSSTQATCRSPAAVAPEHALCFKFGPFCAAQSVLEVFAPALSMFAPTAAYETHVASLTDPMVLQDFNGWNHVHHQNHGCYDMDGVTPGPNGEHPIAHKCICDPSLCNKASCEAGVGAQPSAVASGFTKRVWMSGCSSCDCVGYDALHPNASSAASPFNADRFDVTKVAGGLNGPPGQYTSAKSLFGFYSLNKNEVYIDSTGRVADPLAQEWERQALCKLGIPSPADSPGDGQSLEEEDCPGDPLIKFTAQFARSFGDEFGGAIRGDLVALIVAYYLMAGYLFLMLSRYDSVHSMIGMSCVALTICGMSFMSCMGLGAYVGIYNNHLNTNIPFLLLGLGIDDAFVLTSEFIRAQTLLGPDASIEDVTGMAMKGGAISILITSATDALAFLVGSSTVMPALRWFCLFAGFGIIFCFLFQIFCFVPCLVLNARRTAANRLDCFCCITAKEPHLLNEPQGCCNTIMAGYTPNRLSRFLSQTWGPLITSTQGMAATGAVFFALLVLSIIGLVSIEVDFKMEWFIPDDSYVVDFFSMNDKYFNQGTSFTVYTRETDYFAAQPQLRALDTFLSSSPLVDSTEPVKNWHKSFTAWAATTVEPAAGADNMWAGTFTPSTGIFTTSTAFFGALKTFFQSGDGARYRSSIEWKDTRCQDNDSWNLCNALQGLSATRMTATIASDKLQGGQSRYDTMEELRAELDAKGGALNAFPYAREFSNWEEVGIIGTEMVRNLVICGVVVFVVVFTMIPRPRVAVWVVLCILFSIVDVVGMLYWWDVTVNSISTIYILISIGLAVDYSAHIAHMFKESKGSAQERACAALGRIGPCVLNAIISTFLAVVMFGFSASYIFRVMFKAFFLVVVVAGMHGLWLLPVLLTLGGGDNGVAEEDPLQITADGEGTTDNPLKSAEKEEEEEEEKEQGSD